MRLVWVDRDGRRWLEGFGRGTCHSRESTVLVEKWPDDDRSIRHAGRGELLLRVARTQGDVGVIDRHMTLTMNDLDDIFIIS